MDTKPQPFEPPAPTPRTKPPSLIQMMGIVYRNPLELWGEPSYNQPWISIRTGVGGPLAYLGAARGFSAVTFPDDARAALLFLALTWAAALPLLFRISRGSTRSAFRMERPA